MARPARGGNFTVHANLESADYQRNLSAIGVETREYARGATNDFNALNAAIAAGTVALVSFGAAGVHALKDLQAEMLQVQYLYRDMDRLGRQALEGHARRISGIAGIGETEAAQVFFRLGSTGTPQHLLYREGLPIARAAAALQTDPGGLALATGQGANLARTNRLDYLNLLISTAQVSTSDIEGLRALAPRVLAGGNVAGLQGADTLGLLAYATQTAGSPEEAATGLAALFAEAVKSDSKFGKEFQKTFGESFADAIRGRGAAGFIAELERAYNEWGEQAYFSSFGRRAGLIATPIAADSAFANQIVGSVRTGSAGALESVLEKWEQELPHEFNQLRENINELRLSIGQGANDGVRGALEILNELLSDRELVDALKTLGGVMGGTTSMLAELIVVMATMLEPLAALAGMQIGDVQIGEIAALYLGARGIQGLAGIGGRATQGIKGALGGGKSAAGAAAKGGASRLLGLSPAVVATAGVVGGSVLLEETTGDNLIDVAKEELRILGLIERNTRPEPLEKSNIREAVGGIAAYLASDEGKLALARTIPQDRDRRAAYSRQVERLGELLNEDTIDYQAVTRLLGFMAGTTGGQKLTARALYESGYSFTDWENIVDRIGVGEEDEPWVTTQARKSQLEDVTSEFLVLLGRNAKELFATTDRAVVPGHPLERWNKIFADPIAAANFGLGVGDVRGAFIEEFGSPYASGNQAVIDLWEQKIVPWLMQWLPPVDATLAIKDATERSARSLDDMAHDTDIEDRAFIFSPNIPDGSELREGV